MIHVDLQFEVFLRPIKLPPPVFKWVDLLLTVTDSCVLADCALDRRLWRGLSQSLLRGSGTGGEGEFVFL